MSAGAGLVGLWGDVLSTHCEEAGDVIQHCVNWLSAIWLADGIGRYVATTNNLRRRGRGSGGATRIVSAICWTWGGPP